MKITNVSAICYRQSLILNGPNPKFAGEYRQAFETLLIKVETDEGITGWGEAFPHRIWPVIKQIVDLFIAPACAGANPLDIDALMQSLFKRYYGIGRGGPLIYALSGLDIALWDIAGKVANRSIYQMLGGQDRATVPVYASLLKYGAKDVVVRYCEEALSRGHSDLKIHETGLDSIEAAQCLLRDFNGRGLMVDVNAPWTPSEVMELAPKLKSFGLKWVEEPVWPPEDCDMLVTLRNAGVPSAIGENVLTPADFSRLIKGRFADYLQPSVTKIGGVSVMRDILKEANAGGAAVVPHAAYFGPGLIATAHIVGALSPDPLVERLYCDLAESPFGDWYEPVKGQLSIPTGPGLGVDPDERLLEKLRIA